MMLAFGIGFEFPIVLVSLHLVGRRHHRHAAPGPALRDRGSCVFVAVATPSGDPISMLALTIPMCLLYEVSILIGRLSRPPAQAAGGVTAGPPGPPTGAAASRDLGFTLDRFQVEAIAAIDEGASVLVAAPTGSGKTLVADHAVDRALAAGPEGLLHDADQGAVEPEVRRPPAPARRRAGRSDHRRHHASTAAPRSW